MKVTEKSRGLEIDELMITKRIGFVIIGVQVNKIETQRDNYEATRSLLREKINLLTAFVKASVDWDRRVEIFAYNEVLLPFKHRIEFSIVCPEDRKDFIILQIKEAAGKVGFKIKSFEDLMSS